MLRKNILSKFAKSTFLQTRMNYGKQIIQYMFARSLSSSSTEPNVILSREPDMTFETGNYIQFLMKNLHKWPNRVAKECTKTGQTITYAELRDQSARWSGFLSKVGIRKGETVGYINPNTPSFGPVFLGTASHAAVLTPLNNNYTSGEIAQQLNNSQPSLLVFGNELEDRILEAIQEVKYKPPKLVSIGNSKGAYPDLNQILQDTNIPLLDPVEVSGKQPVLLPYSSGTTGLPKAVPISHNALIANTLMFTHHKFTSYVETTAEHQDVFMGLLPFYHIGGCVVIFSMGVYYGGKTVTIPALDPAQFIPIIEKYKINKLTIVPSLVNLMIHSPACNKKSMSSVNSVLCGAAPVLDSDRKVLLQKMEREDVRFQEVYGLTEVLISHANPIGFNKMHNYPNVKMKIIDTETGETLGANKKGEICLQTPCQMNHYLNNPKATSEMIRDGWVHTGDIGICDDEGFLNVVDRTKDLIKVNALQVSPAEVEDILQSHPKVIEACVVGVPSPKTGEIPKAFVVAKEPLREEELKDFVAQRLAKHKHLHGGVEFVKELPKTGTGKLIRKNLRDLAK